MPRKIGHKRSPQQNSYDKFKEYLHVMHEQAIEIMNTLDQRDKQYVESFFQNYYPTQKEHYWSLKKLFTLAMYIPMFLQIGMSVVNKGKFDALIYIDTHAGPGLAKVGDNKKDIVLGSPLLAIKWPEIVASNIKNFGKISRGFNELFFVEKDPSTYSVLRRIVYNLGVSNAEVIQGDVNEKLLGIRKVIERKYDNPLILMFIDPYGEFSNQIQYRVFHSFVKDWAVDLIYNVVSPNIARGIMGKKNSVNELKTCITRYWGDLCDHNNTKTLKICQCYADPQLCNIGPDDIVTAYRHILKLNKYITIHVVPVDYNKHTLYHLLIASKAAGSYRWINNYIQYLNTKAPRDYNILKNLWLQVTGRQKPIFDFT